MSSRKTILIVGLTLAAQTACAVEEEHASEPDRIADEADELASTSTGTNLLANGNFDERNAIEGVRLSDVRKLRRWTVFAAPGGSSAIIEELGVTDLYQYGGKAGRTTAAQLVKGEAGAAYTLTFGASTGGFGPGEQKVFLDFLGADRERIAHHEQDVRTTDTFDESGDIPFRKNVMTARAPRGTAFVRVAFVAPPDPPPIPDLPGAKVATRYDDVTLTK